VGVKSLAGQTSDAGQARYERNALRRGISSPIKLQYRWGIEVCWSSTMTVSVMVKVNERMKCKQIFN